MKYVQQEAATLIVDGRASALFIGKSTYERPTTVRVAPSVIVSQGQDPNNIPIGTGSACYKMDTKEVDMFDAETQTWTTQ
jgi:hypothetical protein